MNKTMIDTFEELIKSYCPPIYNGTIPVSSIPLDGSRALLRVETASMASKVTFNEALENDALIRKNIITSLEKSLKKNSKVWDELSKY